MSTLDVKAKAKRRWTPEEHRLLEALVAEKLTDRQIGERLGRSTHSISCHRLNKGVAKGHDNAHRIGPRGPLSPLLHQLLDRIEASPLTEAEILKRAGISVGYLSGVRSGNHKPTLPLLEALAEAVDLRLVLTTTTEPDAGAPEVSCHKEPS